MAKSKKPPKRTAPPGRPPMGPPAPPPDPADEPLSHDEQLFVDEYLIDRNAAQAYRRVYAGVAWSTAYTLGPEMRRRPNVEREIDCGIRAMRIRSRVTADKVIQELARIAFSDIIELVDLNTGELRPPPHIPFDMRKAISSYRVLRERRTTTRRRGVEVVTVEKVMEYKLWNKLDALEKLMKHLGLDKEAISPLEAFLAALATQNRTLADQVRQLLAQPQTTPQPSTNGVH